MLPFCCVFVSFFFRIAKCRKRHRDESNTIPQISIYTEGPKFYRLYQKTKGAFTVVDGVDGVDDFGSFKPKSSTESTESAKVNATDISADCYFDS
jgi:hypothetical protein